MIQKRSGEKNWRKLSFKTKCQNHITVHVFWNEFSITHQKTARGSTIHWREKSSLPIKRLSLYLLTFFRLPQIYEEFYHTINNADHEKDLRLWSNTHGVNMAMNWPQFEVSGTSGYFCMMLNSLVLTGLSFLTFLF